MTIYTAIMSLSAQVFKFLLHVLWVLMLERADIKGSDVPSLMSLLVVEERMRSSEYFQHWLETGRASGLKNSAHSYPVI